jgi:hypothetical protein
MWDMLDRLINKPQPAKLAQISPTLASSLESSQGLGETHDFYQWLDRVEGINLGDFVKTGIVTSWDAEGFIYGSSFEHLRWSGPRPLLCCRSTWRWPLRRLHSS